jgi:LPS export ABC transporter protein LptC
MNSLPNNNSISWLKLTKTPSTKLVDTVTAPHFEGVSRNTDLYHIYSSSVTQENEKRAEIEQLTAHLTKKSGTKFQIKADKATILKLDKRLLLKNKVLLTANNNCQINTETAEIEIEQQLAKNNQYLEISCDEGKITAHGFNYSVTKGIINFTGPVTITIY